MIAKDWNLVVNWHALSGRSLICDDCKTRYIVGTPTCRIYRVKTADDVKSGIDRVQCIDCAKPDVPLSPIDLAQLTLIKIVPRSLSRPYDRFLPGLVSINGGFCTVNLTKAGSPGWHISFRCAKNGRIERGSL